MSTTDFYLSKTDRRLRKSDRHFNIGTGLMGASAGALVFVLVAWAVRGSEFKDGFHGDAAIVVCCAGLIVGALLDFLARTPRNES